MAKGLPTLSRDWASLGASNAPKANVPADSPRIATALNTFASYIDAERQVYISVRRTPTHPGPSERPSDQCVPGAHAHDAVRLIRRCAGQCRTLAQRDGEQHRARRRCQGLGQPLGTSRD